VGASLPVTTASTSPACVEFNTAWPSSIKIMCFALPEYPLVPTGDYPSRVDGRDYC
jgi:hypothetical protein